MNMFQSKESRTFLIIAILLGIGLCVLGIWSANKIKSKDEAALGVLLSDFQNYQKDFSAELGKIEANPVLYENPESQIDDLNKTIKSLEANIKLIQEKPKDAMRQMPQLYDSKKLYDTKMDQFVQTKDGYVATTLQQLKDEIKKIKAKLDEVLAQNKKMSQQLSYAISQKKKAESKLAGVSKELEMLQSEKVRLDSIFSASSGTRAGLDSLMSDRDQLQKMLAASEKQILEQKALIEKLKGMTAGVNEFRAEYEFKKRRVPLDKTGKHTRANVGKELFVTFNVGPALFEPEDQAKIVYLTLFKDGVAYQKYNKIPIKVDANFKANYKMLLTDKLEKGEYFFMLSYKEKFLMEGYSFVIQ